MNTTPYQWLRTVVTVLLVGGAASACASRPSSHLADAFLRGNEPEMNLGDLPKKPDPDELYAGNAASVDREVEVHDRPAVPLAGTVEDSDPYLMTALVRAKVDPTPEHHRRVAELYQGHGILDQAYDHLDAAAKLDPRDAVTQDRLARLWRSWGLAGFGLGAAYRAVSYAPNSPEAWNTLGTLLQEIGWRAHAREAYEAAIAREPRAAYALNNLCYLSFADGKFSAAIEACQTAIAIDPTLAAAHNNLALVYFAMNEDELARSSLEASGAPSTALYNLGIAHLARGDHEEAAALFTRASRVKPNWAAPRQRASQALSHTAARPEGQ